MSPAPGDAEMTLANLLSSRLVIPEMTSLESDTAIVELVDHLVAEGAIPTESRDAVLVSLKEREDDRSTGIGNGIAIPHCFSDDIDEVALVFGRSEQGIEFCALDRAPVFFVVLFVVPKSQYALHLKTLAAIAKILNSAKTRERLSEAKDAEEIYQILSNKSASV